MPCAADDPACKLSTDPQRATFSSRGGEKLRGALDAFKVDPRDRDCLDVGSSTGGFTDCLLQAGARSVSCIDVGYGLLDWRLRNDPRVHLFERTNFRFFDPAQLSHQPNLAVVDLSFIALEKILRVLYRCLSAKGEALVLVKPQFEGTPKEAPGGIVRDETIRQAILARARTGVLTNGFILQGESDSCLRGRKGNQETFFHLKPGAG